MKRRTLYMAAAIAVSGGLFYVAKKAKDSNGSPALAPALTTIDTLPRPLTALVEPKTGLLSPTLRTATHPPSANRLRDEIAARVAESGAAETADQLVSDTANPPAQRQAAMEALTVAWASDDAIAASRWLLQNTGKDGPVEGKIEAAVWEAAVSGYIEGIVESDPETAARLANLLVPQTRLPAANPNNRAAPELETKPETIEEILAEVSGVEPTTTVAESTPPDDDMSEPTSTTTEPVEGLGDEFSPEVRDARFPGDPGFPGDPDFLTRNRGATGG